MGDLSENFSAWEFACKCGCGTGAISPVLVNRLQDMREAMGHGITIRSGIRCPAHNKFVGGNPGSEHIPSAASGLTEGADLGYSGSRERQRLALATHTYFRRIGIAETFFHVGIRASKAQDVTWIYPLKKKESTP